MKEVIGEIMREFYEFGIPEDVRPRDVDYFEKRNSATVVTGMRRTGKTYVTYQRMRALVEEGVPLERIVHVNFDDDRLKGVKLEHLNFLMNFKTSTGGSYMPAGFWIRIWCSSA